MPLVGAARRDLGWMAVGQTAALAQFALVALSFATLIHAYVTSDFSVVNVAENSHTAKPLLYKITGVWGNHEGSMLLWVFILSLFGGAVAWFGGNLPPALRARVLAVQGMIGTGFLVFILLTSNPFIRVWPAPENGNGLNPSLQNPYMVAHPVLLYLGYVGLAVPFAFAMGALLSGRTDERWIVATRRWTIVAWTALGVGQLLGAHWAYQEVGWGGYYAWDPVENAALMPWLAATAYMHSVMIQEKRGMLRVWNVTLVSLAFCLSLFGTFLTRSGVVSSIHSFTPN